MAYNGSGTFVRSHNWVTDKTNVVPVTASRMDTECDGFATGLSTALCKDGQQTATARVPFALGVSSMDGSVSSASYAHVSDLNTGLYFPAADQWGLSAGGVGTLTSTATAITFGSGVSLTMSAGFTVTSATPTITLIDTDTGADAEIHASSTTGSLTLSADANNEVANTVIRFTTDGTPRAIVGPTSIIPAANDLLSLGEHDLSWADLFLASGAVIGFGDGNYTLTHSAGLLTASNSFTSAGTVTAANVTASSQVAGATAGGAMLATQAEQETGTATDKLVTPGRQHFHPTAAKAYGTFNAAGTLGSVSHNVSGVVKDSVGDWTVSFSTAMSTATYAVVLQLMDEVNRSYYFVRTRAVGSFTVKMVDINNSDLDISGVMSFVVYGDI